MNMKNWLSGIVIAAAAVLTTAAGCAGMESDELASDSSSIMVITKSDLDAIPRGAELKLSADGGYRFDTGSGSVSLDRIVIGETESPIRASFRDAGLSDSELGWIERAGFTLTPTSNEARGTEHSSLAAGCTDRAYYTLYWVAPSGSVSEYQVWFCRA